MSKQALKSIICALLFLLAPGGSLVRATTAKEGRNYLQYIPLTPFLGEDDLGRKYFRHREPVAAWKITGTQPTWEEVVVYKQKLESLRDQDMELKKQAIAQTQTEEPAPIDEVPDLKSIQPMPLRYQDPRVSEKPPAQITVSPWLNIPTPSKPEESGSENMHSSSEGGHGGEVMQAPMVLKKTLPDGSEIYIPFSQIPGVNPPPSATTAPSTAIYSQPPAMEEPSQH